MRLFVGLELDPPVRAAIAASAQEAARRMPGNFYEPDLYHITLAFLGEIDPARLPMLKNTLSKAHFTPFPVKTGALDSFEKGILYCGIAWPCEKLHALQEEICRVLCQDGWTFDAREYVPHITLARKARGNTDGISPAQTSMHVNAFSLFESARIDGKLCYTPIQRWRADEERNK